MAAEIAALLHIISPLLGDGHVSFSCWNGRVWARVGACGRVSLLITTLVSCGREATSPDDSTARVVASGDLGSYFAGPYAGSEILFDQISKESPTFAGVYLDKGQLVVLATDSGQHLSTIDVVSRILPQRLRANRAFVARTVKYSFVQLAEFRATVFRALPSGVNSIDVDEVQNVVGIGADNEAAASQAAKQLRSNGIPEDAIRMAISPGAELRQLQTLVTAVRPIPAGVEHSKQGPATCTVGLNGQWGATYPIYFTASHCSNKWYGLDAGTTWFFQPTSPQFVPNRVGWEWDDPTPGNGSACPSGTYCRWSDVLAVRYKHDSLTAGPHIARVGGSPGYGAPGGDQIIVGDFYVMGSFPYSIVGEELQKIGRTTQWTRGYVTATCQAKDSGQLMPGTSTHIWILCNDISDIYSDKGDSGAPIFKWYGDGNAYFAGILWGGPSQNPNETWHSPFTSIVHDMGQYTFYVW